MGCTDHIVDIWLVDDLPEEAIGTINAVLADDAGVNSYSIPPVLAQIVLPSALDQH